MNITGEMDLLMYECRILFLFDLHIQMNQDFFYILKIIIVFVANPLH